MSANKCLRMGHSTVLLVLLGLAGLSYGAKLSNLGGFQPLDNDFLNFQPLPSNSINNGQGRSQLQGSANIQPSFNFGEARFNEFLGSNDYLPPVPSNPTPVSCAPVTVTTTLNNVVTNLQPSTAFNYVVVTSTIIQTTTVVQAETITITETVINTVSSTQATTLTRTDTRTEVQTSLVTIPGGTQFITQTQTVPTVIVVDTTRIQVETHIIPSTIVQFITSTVVVPTQVIQYVTNTQTNTVFENVPGQTVVNTQTVTVTNTITQTVPGQTVVNTVFQTSVALNNIVQTVGGGIEEVFSTQVVPIATTVFNTQFITVTQTQTVNSNVVITQTSNVVSTQIVPTTVVNVNTQTITLPFENVITSVVTVPTTRVVEVVSTRISNVINTVDVVNTQTDNQVITVPGGVSVIVSTSFVINNVVNTVTVTNTVGGGVVTISQTVTQTCGGATGYNYNRPSGRSFRFPGF